MDNAQAPDASSSGAQPTDAQGAAQPQGAPAMSPKVADAFRRLLLAAMKILYSDPQTSRGFVDMVAQAPDAPGGIAHAAHIVVERIAKASSGIDPTVVERIAVPVAMMIAEMAIEAGAIKDDPDLASEIVQALDGGQAQDAPPADAQEGEAGSPAAQAAGTTQTVED